MANNVANNTANNFQTSQNSGAAAGAPNVPNPVGMTAHALLETLLAQVIAHSMNGNAPSIAGTQAGVPPSTPTTPTPAVPFNSNVTGESTIAFLFNWYVFTFALQHHTACTKRPKFTDF